MTTKTLTHKHKAATVTRDASDGGYTREECRCGAVRIKAWSKHRRDRDDGRWVRAGGRRTT